MNVQTITRAPDTVIVISADDRARSFLEAVQEGALEGAYNGLAARYRVTFLIGGSFSVAYVIGNMIEGVMRETFIANYKPTSSYPDCNLQIEKDHVDCDPKESWITKENIVIAAVALPLLGGAVVGGLKGGISHLVRKLKPE